MKLFTKHTDYAVRALVYLAKAGMPFASSRQIAHAERIPLPFMRRILQVLTQNKFIGTKEGVNGGVALIKEPGNIFLIDIAGLFQGPIDISPCTYRTRACHNRRKCVLRRRLKVIESQLIRDISTITIEDLLK